jgi:hypothetical protein
MDVPAQHWTPSPRCFLQRPKAWDYPEPLHVCKVRENAGIWTQGHWYFISRAFIGENVQLQFLENTVLVWFCRTLIRELNLKTRTSSAVDFGQFDRARTQGL